MKHEGDDMGLGIFIYIVPVIVPDAYVIYEMPGRISKTVAASIIVEQREDLRSLSFQAVCHN